MIKKLPMLAAALLLIGAPATFVLAKENDHDLADQAAARAALARGEILSIGRILGLAQQKVAGDVLKVKLERQKTGAFKYEVKILASNGRVREVELDARTGGVIKIEDD